MPTKEEQFDALITSISDGTFQGDSIDLAGFGLSDDYVSELLGVINGSKFKTSIKEIDLSNNWLTVPPDVEQYTELNFLYLHHNPFKTPPNVTKCHKLQALGLMSNSLSEAGKIALDVQRRKNLTIGGIEVGRVRKTLTTDLLRQHVIDVADEYLNTESDSLMDEELADQVLDLVREHLSILLSIFDSSEAYASESRLISSLLSQNSNVMTIIYEKCPAIIYRNAMLAESTDISKSKSLYLKAARLGNTMARDKIEEYLGINKNKYLDIIKCNISLDIMLNPVTTPSGHSYDEKSIKHWMETSKTFLDPIRQPLDVPAGSGKVSIVPNHTLEKLIDYMVDVSSDITHYPGFFDPITKIAFEDPHLTLEGKTVEKNDKDHTLRRDLVLGDLIKYVKHTTGSSNTLRLSAS